MIGCDKAVDLIPVVIREERIPNIITLPGTRSAGDNIFSTINLRAGTTTYGSATELYGSLRILIELGDTGLVNLENSGAI